MNELCRENGSPLRLERKISSGGEGSIHTVVGEPHLVAKIYYEYSPERALKLQYMLKNPPDDPTRSSGHISIAWPTERIFDTQRKCIGFLMPFLEPTGPNSPALIRLPLLTLYNPKDRRQTWPAFSWAHLLFTARNFASVLQALHDKGYVVGDLNESNILVTGSALVTLVDCDSIQVRGQDQIFRCPVGKPEYTPPELQGAHFSQVDRTPSQDNFGLAVLTFLLLMEGRHPFTGIWQGAGSPPSIEQNIRARRFPYAGSFQLHPPKNALQFDTLPRPVQQLMRRSLTWRRWKGFRGRPTARAWYRALKKAEKQLATCGNSPRHFYSGDLPSCPWCERISQGMPDPFPVTNAPLLQVGRNVRYAQRHEGQRRISNASFGCLIPLILLGAEGIYWYWHQHALDQWFSQAETSMKALVLLAALIVPFMASFLLRVFMRMVQVI